MSGVGIRRRPAARVTFFIVLLSLASVTAVTPTRPTHRAALIRVLAGIDTVPSAADLRRAAPEKPADQLAQVALDPTVDGWIRLRAVSVLPALGVTSSAPLLRLAATKRLPERMRWWAVFSWLRSPVAEAVAVAHARRWLADPAWLIRDAAARGLRHRRGAAVTKLLRAALLGERNAAVRAALRRVLRGRP